MYKRQEEKSSVATEEMSSVATEEMSSVATEEISSVATEEISEEISSVATEEMSSVATEEMSSVRYMKVELFRWLSGVAMDRNGLILWENEATGSRKVFRCLLDLRDVTFELKVLPDNRTPQNLS